MVLENFLIDVDVLWDRAGKELYEKPQARAGRKMRVRVTNKGLVEDLTGYTLNLGWKSTIDETKFGLDAFTAVDITKGIFELAYTSGMLTNIGTLVATLQLVPSEGAPTESNNFTITVKKSAVDAAAIQSENSFTALETALVEVTGWNARIDDVEQQFIDKANNLDAIYPIELNSVKQQLAETSIFASYFGVSEDALDNSPDLNRAIQFVKESGGGKLVLPKGQLTVSSPIFMESQVSLLGQGRDVTTLRPNFSTGEVITAKGAHKQKPTISDLTIKPLTYQSGLIGISYKYFQYGTVERVDVFNCGVSYDFNGQFGCYYNKQVQTRAISTGIGVRFGLNGATTGNRPNANEITDLTILSPIVGVKLALGNSNKLYDIKVESLEAYYPHPTVSPDGSPAIASDRWVLSITSGFYNYIEKIRSEFDGNLLMLGTSYGSFLKDFFCNYNGTKSDYITLQETPTLKYETNDLTDVFLGWSSPVLAHQRYDRVSRLTYTPTIGPQMAFTPRDYPGQPLPRESGYKRGHVHFSADGEIFVATSDDVFKKVDWQSDASTTVEGKVKYQKKTVTLPIQTVPAGQSFTATAYMTGVTDNDSVFVTTNIKIPNGLVPLPIYTTASLGNAKLAVVNATQASITVPEITFCFTMITI